MFERLLEILAVIATALQSIATSMQTGAAVGTVAGSGGPTEPPAPGNGTATAPTETKRPPGRPPKATTAPAPAPVTAGSPPAGTASTGTSGAADFKAVTEAAMALAKKPVDQGGGREVLLKILQEYLPGVEKPSLSMLEPLNKNAEILARINGTPADAGAADDDMFS